MLKLHKELSKTQNFIIIQLQSDKTELTVFLHKKKIFDIFFSDCFCKRDRETSKHVIIHCIKHSEMHRKLKIDE